MGSFIPVQLLSRILCICMISPLTKMLLEHCNGMFTWIKLSIRRPHKKTLKIWVAERRDLKSHGLHNNTIEQISKIELQQKFLI